MRKRIIYLLPLLFLLGSCKVFFPNTLFRTSKDFKYANYDTTLETEYLVRAGDILDLKVFSNNGYELVDVVNTVIQRANELGFVVSPQGYAIFPLLDTVLVVGKTLPEVDRILQKEYSYYFVNPYVKTRELNRRAILFMGSDKSYIVQLTNENTGIMEVLANSGGMAENLKADKIKIIRGDLKNPEVYLIDLSTIDGLEKASTMNIEPNDVIYVQPSENLVNYMSRLTPVFSFISTAIGLYLSYMAVLKRI